MQEANRKFCSFVLPHFINKTSTFVFHRKSFCLLSVQNLAELSDSSDEEGPLIRIGEIPLSYYEDERHTGYDIDGNKVIVKGRGDQISLFLLKRDKDAAK